MKLIAILLIACVSASYGMSIPKVDQQALEQEKIFGFVNDFVQQIIVAPTNVLAQNLAGIGSHMFATLAEHGLAVFGKRDAAEQERILGLLTQLGNTIVEQVIMPTANQLVQDLALATTQVLADIASGNINLIGKRETEEERILSALTQLGTTIVQQVIMPTANQLVQDAALQVTQVLADIASGNINLIGKRDVADPKFLAALQQLGTTIVQQVIVPTVDQMVQDAALAVTQVLADIASGNINLIGKRTAEVDPKILNLLTQLGTTIVQQVIVPTVDQLVQDAALAVTQVLADVASGNINLIGKRDATEEERILSALMQLGTTIVDNVIMPAANQLVQDVALQVTQVLADVASGNINLIGKRDAEEERILGLLTQLGNTIVEQVIMPTANQLVQDLALATTQVLADIASGNINLIGKRNAEEERILGLLTQLGNTIVEQVIMPTANQLVQDLALATTQVLADIASGNINLIGKRDAEQERILAALTQLGNTIVSQVIMPTVDQMVQDAALAVTQVLADIASGNINLIGKRDAQEEKILAALTQLGTTIVQQVIMPTVDQMVQDAALAVTQVLADIASGNINLIGKRNAEVDPKILNLLTQLGTTIVQQVIVPTVDQLVQDAALAVTQVLADVASGNINLIGKREVDQAKLFGLISNAVNTVANQAYELINLAVQTASFHIAVTLANIAENGLIGKRASF